MNKKGAASLLGASVVFLVGLLAWPGETHERTFDTPGVYPYVCEPHETDYDMKGVVRVVP